MPIVNQPNDDRPLSERVHDAIRQTVDENRRLIAAGIRWGRTDSDLAGLVEGRLAELKSSAAVLEAQMLKYRRDLDSDLSLMVVDELDGVLSTLLRARQTVLR